MLTPQEINKLMTDKADQVRLWLLKVKGQPPTQVEVFMEGYRTAWADVMAIVQKGVNNVHR